MKFRTVRIKISRGWSYALYCVSFLVLSFLSAHAGTLNDSIRSKVVISGNRPQAGDTISGWVLDSDGPMIMTNVVERDSKDRIVSHAITDQEGHFSLKVVDPQNRIQVSYVGYDMAESQINGSVFVITMECQVLEETGGYQDVNGLKIPLREASSMVKTIDMNEFTELAYGVPGPMYEEPWSKYLNKNTELTVYLDGNRVKLSYEQQKSFVYDNVPLDRESLARLLDIKKSKLKAVRLISPTSGLKSPDIREEATVMEVATKKYYRQLRKEGRLTSSYRILK